jgi:hypothetical protein
MMPEDVRYVDFAQIRYAEVCMLMSNLGLTEQQAKHEVRRDYNRTLMPEQTGAL